ncbi:hypothetical protein GWO43_25080 [candidate division KSB1 bacterium]|nr:hypothetical protein [candidate division KSB1 bacterium]NIR68838.1 hypothetical protein [candidate division KSB1 bacterium]NIS27202.1 hypothetical protein [candidate division KSB1 bacterium]NIT74087.1 hypothetical protein [candidate division KSB1 bacterium]NIU27936.1 hypothetical protein [candidate division KSB1 bacterium]
MEEHNPRLKKAILQVVSNQLRMNEPPETKETLNRLISEGYSEQDAKELIGAVVSAHIYDMLKEQHEFDNSKYIKDLKKLPELPWDSESKK